MLLIFSSCCHTFFYSPAISWSIVLPDKGAVHRHKENELEPNMYGMIPKAKLANETTRHLHSDYGESVK